MKIREEQLIAFAPVADQTFAARVARRVREKHPGAEVLLPSGPTTVARLPEALLLALVTCGIERARRYGIGDEYGMAAYVVMFITAPNFDAHPIPQRLLEAEGDAVDKMDRLLDAASEENWQAVRQSYDPTAWGV